METVNAIVGHNPELFQTYFRRYNETNFPMGLRRNSHCLLLFFKNSEYKNFYINFQKIAIRYDGFYFIPSHQYYFLPPHPNTHLVAYQVPYFVNHDFYRWALWKRYSSDYFIGKSFLQSISEENKEEHFINHFERILNNLPLNQIASLKKISFQSALEFIDALYEKPMNYETCSVPKFAGKINIHERNLQRTCKAVFGRTAKEIIHHHLLSEICMKLIKDSTEKLEIISLYFGFNEVSCFSRFFKNEMGIVPSEFRKEFQAFNISFDYNR